MAKCHNWSYRIVLLGDTQYILRLTSPPMCWNCLQRDKKVASQHVLYQNSCFYFFSPPTRKKNPCWDLSTIEYTECCLTLQQPNLDARYRWLSIQGIHGLEIIFIQLRFQQAALSVVLQTPAVDMTSQLTSLSSLTSSLGSSGKMPVTDTSLDTAFIETPATRLSEGAQVSCPMNLGNIGHWKCTTVILEHPSRVAPYDCTQARPLVHFMEQASQFRFKDTCYV